MHLYSRRSERPLNRVTSCIRKTCNHTPNTRSIRSISTNSIDPNSINHGSYELDSHADTCLASLNTVVIEYTAQIVNVSAFSSHHDIMQDIRIGTLAVPCDRPLDSTTIIQILQQAMIMNDIVYNTLLCLNQLWH
jgi:hypothetical protein